jgi:hypothetical protein
VAAVYLSLLEFAGVYRFVCRIADSPSHAKAVDENGQERRIESHVRFERVTTLFVGSVAFIGDYLLG